MKFEQVRELLDNNLTSRGDGATDSEVRSAELLIGRFPTDYRQFVVEYGWVVFKHYEVYGLGVVAPQYLHVVHMTQVERLESDVPLPDSLVCVMNDGGGNLFCFDSSQVDADPERQAPILFWDHELGEGQVPTVVAVSFSAWLESLLTE